MTDKQIIIDGIDMSGCEWISEVGLDSEYICNCNSPNKTSGYCKYNPNCCYKQLKRKEQECERLKKANDSILTTLNVIAKGNIKLRQTLTEIKEIANAIVNGTHFTDNIEEHFKELNKQILQKISEVIENE